MKPTKDDLKKQLNATETVLRHTQAIARSQAALLSEASEKATIQEQKIALLELKCQRLWALKETLNGLIDEMIECQ